MTPDSEVNRQHVITNRRGMGSRPPWKGQSVAVYHNGDDVVAEKDQKMEDWVVWLDAVVTAGEVIVVPIHVVSVTCQIR